MENLFGFRPKYRYCKVINLLTLFNGIIGFILAVCSIPPSVHVLKLFCTSHFQKHLELCGKLPERTAKMSSTNLYHQMVQLREMFRFTVELPASVHNFLIRELKIENSKRALMLSVLSVLHVHVVVFFFVILLQT